MSELLTIPGTLRGYRAWYPKGVTATGIELRPLTYQPRFAWVDGENVAQCNMRVMTKKITTAPVHTTPAPQWDCRCGLYARYEPIPYSINVEVVGVVEAYGRVILGERGFRAEKARILGLLVPPWMGIARFLQKTYPQAQIFVTAEEMLEAFPPPPDVPNMFGPEVAQEWPQKEIRGGTPIYSSANWHVPPPPSPEAIQYLQVRQGILQQLQRDLKLDSDGWEVVNG